MGQKNLPLASGNEHAEAFVRLGWVIKKARTHITLEKQGVEANLSIPNHGEVSRALIQDQMRCAGVTEEDYLEAFHSKVKRR